MGRGRRISDAVLVRLRKAPMVPALVSVGVYAKQDLTYQPRGDVLSERWHFSVSNGGTFEVVVTGVRWFDLQAGVGQAGALDLTMHVLGLSLPEAAKRLAAAGW